LSNSQENSYESIKREVDEYLRRLCSSWEAPGRLAEAMSYSLLAGGKRLRPVLAISACRMLGATADPMPAAAALEMVHTYSLIHDDLPAMDNDDLRRGLPTCHKRFDEATAILAGDALLTESFGLLASAYNEISGRLISELARAAGMAGMVGGQQLDIEATGRIGDQDSLERLCRLKTGALITCALRFGAFLAQASPEDLQALTDYGRSLGLAFQVADDIIDATQSRERAGKATGKDQARGKASYVVVLGLAQAREKLRALCRQAGEHLKRFSTGAQVLHWCCDRLLSDAGC
jgi:geranylgeranyl pyrophosphate synthase